MAFVLAAKIDLARNPETEDERTTVRQLKIALNRLGFYTPNPNIGMTDDIDVGLKDAVYAFQRKATIYFDDVALGPGTTTERILNRDLAVMDDHAFYIWHTVGDHKVRGEHARRNGQTFSWANPPDDENPGEDYNCRCWAEPINPSRHPWNEWTRQRQQQRFAQSSVTEKLAPLKELKTEIPDLMTPVDAINPTISPLDIIGWGAVPAAKYIGRPIVTEIAKRQLAREAAKRDVEWIRNASRDQLQKKFKHANIFGVQGNQSNKTLEAYKKALEDHVKSPSTIERPGTLHKKAATHYYDPKTYLNVTKDVRGNFRSAWKLSEEQMEHMKATGDLGGGTK